MALLSKLEVKAPDKSLKPVSQAFVPRIPSTQATCLLQREEANKRTIKIPEIPCLSCIFLFLSSFRIFFFKRNNLINRAPNPLLAIFLEVVIVFLEAGAGLEGWVDY